jgi:protocatechuate 3,4-dioxygenase beta subunit
MLNRSDIRSDPDTGEVRAGVPLTLTFFVSEIGEGCVPLQGAQVDIWHCDAAGVYSDVQDRGFTSTGQKFLRGYQLTDANGQATFTTVYPGWYSGRAVHIHFKVRLTSAAGQAYEFTSQVFFDESVNDAVHAREPYAARGQRDVMNRADRIYDEQLVVAAAPEGDGYTATFDLGLNTA